MESRNWCILTLLIAMSIFGVILLVITAGNSLSNGPCKDFYHFACGGQPDGDLTLDPGIEIEKKFRSVMQTRIKDILSSPVVPQDTRALVMAKEFYSDCMNTSTGEILSQSRMLLTKWLERLGGWEMLHSDSNIPSNSTSLIELFQGVVGYDANIGFFHNKGLFRVIVDSSDSGNVFKIYAPWMTASRQEEEFFQPTTFVGNLKFLFEDAVAQDEDLILKISRIQALHKELVAAYRRDKGSKFLKLSEFQKWMNYEEASKDEMIDWVGTLSSIHPNVRVISDEDWVLLAPVTYFQELASIQQRTDINTIKSYMILNTIYPFLTQVFLKEQKVDMSEGRIQIPRDICTEILYEDEAGHLFPFVYAVGHEYFLRYASDENIDGIFKLFELLKEAFVLEIHHSSWIDALTRVRLVDHVKNATTTVYPQWMVNRTALEQHYSQLHLERGKLVENYLKLFRFQANIGLTHENKLLQLQEYFGILSFQPKYSLKHNILSIPMGSKWPKVIRSSESLDVYHFATLGSLMGQQLARGVLASDDVSGILDLPSLWTEESKLVLMSNVKKCLQTYSQYTPTSTLDNTSEVLGVQVAFKALSIWKNITRSGSTLLKGYTWNQAFFLLHAEGWCKRAVGESATSPGQRVRTSVLVSSIGDFSETWHCPLSSSKNPVTGCSLLD